MQSEIFEKEVGSEVLQSCVNIHAQCKHAKDIQFRPQKVF